MKITRKCFLRLIRVELITFGTEIQRSIQLSYKRYIKIRRLE